MQKLRIEVDKNSPVRVDALLTEHIPGESRSGIQARIRRLFINGNEAKFSKKVRAGDIVEAEFNEPEPLHLEPESVPFDILYENSDVLVVNKPRGLVVHPGNGNRTGTLVQGVLGHLSDFPEEELRPGIVHRLDKDTSGVLIIAKNRRAQDFLASQFRRRKTRKVYLAVTEGTPLHLQGEIDLPVGRHPYRRTEYTTIRSGKPAHTVYQVAAHTETRAFVKLEPKTGRTHQLRVHMKSLGCPILGDPVYGRGRAKEDSPPMMLHALRLEIRLPGEEFSRHFTAPIPSDFLFELRQSF